jgi:carbohydrate diacid regulator
MVKFGIYNKLILKGSVIMAVSIDKQTAQKVVDTVKDVCGYDINFINSDGTIFASTNSARIGDFHEIGKQVIDTASTIEVNSNDSFWGTQKGVNIPFIYHKQVCAVIGISGEPDEVRKYAYLAQKITSLILREHELDYLNYGKKNELNYIIRSLVGNEAINHDYFIDFIENYNLSIKCDYCTILVKINARYNPANLSMLEQSVIQAFEQTENPLYTFQYPNDYIMIMASSDFKKWEYVFRILADKYKEILKIGVGNSCSLDKQHLSYESALLAINSLSGNNNIAYFDNLDLDILLGAIPQNAKERYLMKTISSLSDDEKNLLKIYFDNDMSLKETCEALFIHKNTLQYKLDKIANKCGYNPRVFKDASILYLALKM